MSKQLVISWFGREVADPQKKSRQNNRPRSYPHYNELHTHHSCLPHRTPCKLRHPTLALEGLSKMQLWWDAKITGYLMIWKGGSRSSNCQDRTTETTLDHIIMSYIGIILAYLIEGHVDFDSQHQHRKDFQKWTIVRCRNYWLSHDLEGR